MRRLLLAGPFFLVHENCWTGETVSSGPVGALSPNLFHFFFHFLGHTEEGQSFRAVPDFKPDGFVCELAPSNQFLLVPLAWQTKLPAKKLGTHLGEGSPVREGAFS